MGAVNAMAGYGFAPSALGAARIGLPLTAAMGSSVLLISNLNEEVNFVYMLSSVVLDFLQFHELEVLSSK